MRSATRGWNIFSSVMLDVLLKYKWKIFVWRFGLDLVLFIIHLVFSTIFIMYSSTLIEMPLSEIYRPCIPRGRFTGIGAA